MAPGKNFNEAAQVNVAENVDYAAEARQALLLKELALNRREQACDYAIDKYHQFQDSLNTNPQYGKYRRQVIVLGKDAAGQATRLICDLDGIEEKLKNLRTKSKEYKEHEILDQYQQFLKQLGHLKAEAKDVLGEVAADAAEAQAAKAKELRERAQNYKKKDGRTQQSEEAAV